MDAIIFDSALSHTRRSNASEKKEENSVSTFERFRLWASFESSPVSVKYPFFIHHIFRSETQMTSSLHLSRTSTLWPTKSLRSLSIVIRPMWTTETLAENSSTRQLTTLDGVVDKNTISSYLYSYCHILAFLLSLSDQKITKKLNKPRNRHIESF